MVRHEMNFKSFLPIKKKKKEWTSSWDLLWRTDADNLLKRKTYVQRKPLPNIQKALMDMKEE